MRYLLQRLAFYLFTAWAAITAPSATAATLRPAQPSRSQQLTPLRFRLARS